MPFSSSWSAVGFSVAGDHAQGAVSGRHRLRRGQVLTVDMRHRRRFAIIGVVAVLLLVHARRLRPHGAHGHFVELLHFHAIGHKGAPALVRFAVMAHAPLMQRCLQLAVMLVRDQIANGLAEVPQEPVAGFGAFHYLPGENRHPGQRIVATQLLELRDHVVGPVLRTRLPTIVNHVADAALAHVIRADRLLVAVQVGFM